MAFTGQIGQKANWANCFFQCVQGMLWIISIIYIIINIIYILYLLLTWKSRCAYMKMPNLLLPNLPTNSGLSSTRLWRGWLWHRGIGKAESQRSYIGGRIYWKIERWLIGREQISVPDIRAVLHKIKTILLWGETKSRRAVGLAGREYWFTKRYYFLSATERIFSIWGISVGIMFFATSHTII